MVERCEINKSVRKILHDGERVFLYAEQSKRLPGGAVSLPDSLYITSSRIIFRSPKLMGFKSDIESIYYHDIISAHLKRGYLSSEIMVKTKRFKDELVLPAVNKKLAEKALSLILEEMARISSRELIGNEVKRNKSSTSDSSTIYARSAITILYNNSITAKSSQSEINDSALKEFQSTKMKVEEIDQTFIPKRQQSYTQDINNNDSKSSSSIGITYQPYTPSINNNVPKSSSPIGVVYDANNAIIGSTHLAGSVIRTAAAIDLMTYQTRDDNMAYAEESNSEGYVEESNSEGYVEESNSEGYVEDNSFDFSFDF